MVSVSPTARKLKSALEASVQATVAWLSLGNKSVSTMLKAAPVVSAVTTPAGTVSPTLLQTIEGEPSLMLRVFETSTSVTMNAPV